LESVCQENNFVATFQNYRVIPNCFDGSVKIKPRKSYLNDSEKVKSTLISPEIPESNGRITDCQNVASQEKMDSGFQGRVSHSALHIFPEEPVLEELVIEDTILSKTDQSESVTPNITAVFSCPPPPEMPQESLDRNNYKRDNELSCNGEKVPSSGSFLDSIVKVELKPPPNVTRETCHRKGEMMDINIALNNAIQHVRQIGRLSVCDEYGDEDDWSQ